MWLCCNNHFAEAELWTGACLIYAACSHPYHHIRVTARKETNVKGIFSSCHCCRLVMGCTLCSVVKYFFKTAIDKEGIYGGKMCYSSNWSSYSRKMLEDQERLWTLSFHWSSFGPCCTFKWSVIKYLKA